ncbi:MAG: type II toxin-antitoxin system prevent-host-death family antitoxin [Gemmatimonadota bacterium]
MMKIDKEAMVNVHEAKTHLSRLLERVHLGEEIILAKAGKPYAKLVPLEAGGERVAGRLGGRIIMTEDFFEALPEEELRVWEEEG